MNHVPQEPEEQEVPSLLTIAEIAETYGVSRQTVHNLRRRGVFPDPVPQRGTTRLKWARADLDPYFEANPKQPGKKIEKRLRGSEQDAVEHDAGTGDSTD